jgi:hypothetical protein
MRLIRSALLVCLFLGNARLVFAQDSSVAKVYAAKGISLHFRERVQILTSDDPYQNNMNTLGLAWSTFSGELYDEVSTVTLLKSVWSDEDRTLSVGVQYLDVSQPVGSWVGTTNGAAWWFKQEFKGEALLIAGEMALQGPNARGSLTCAAGLAALSHKTEFYREITTGPYSLLPRDLTSKSPIFSLDGEVSYMLNPHMSIGITCGVLILTSAGIAPLPELNQAQTAQQVRSASLGVNFGMYF